jgi:DDE superfamily endonuclease/Tc5 transposase DNA-binding domain
METQSPETRLQQALCGYQLGVYPSLKAAASALEVPPSTLKHRAAGRKSKHEEAQKRLAMDVNEEQVLIDWILQLHRLGIPARPSRLREMADHIRGARTTQDLPPLGPNWATRFISRHPEIKSVISVKLDKDRWDNVTKESMQAWFDLLQEVKTEFRILDSNVYNMDEKGCILGVSERARILIPSSSRVNYAKQPGNRESITVIECICSTGTIIPPFVIWSAKSHRDNWVPLNMKSSMNGSVFATSPNGYTDHELGFEWVSKVFHPATASSSRGHTRLLLMDGHSSHLTSQFLGFCHDNNILPLCLPPHTTHLLQPLDVGCFAPLAHYYRAEVDEASHYGLHGVTKCDFLQFYSTAREKAFTISNINSAFRKTGIVPLQPSAILDTLIPQDDDFNSLTHNDGELPRPGTSSSSFQTPRDYAKLLEYCNRLEEYIVTHGNEESPSRKLSSKVCHAVVRKSAEFAILQRDNAGLTKVIAAKAERKQLTRRVLSTGRVLTLVQIHKAREEERKREAERQTAKDRRKEKAGRQLKKKEEKRRKRKRDVAASARSPSERLQVHGEEVVPGPERWAREVQTNTTEFDVQSWLHVGDSTSDDNAKTDNHHSEALIAGVLDTSSHTALTASLARCEATEPLLAPGHKRPPTCSGCGTKGHTFRVCSQNPCRKA